MAEKQKSEFDVSEIAPTKSATVHGIFVGETSPVKCSKSNSSVKYFHTRLTDGKKTVRVVSFEPKLRSDIEKAREDGVEVAVSKCSVQKGKRPGGTECDDLEIIVGSRTNLSKSPKKFKVDETSIASCSSTSSGATEIRALEEVGDLAVNQRVTLTAKVVDVKASETVHSKMSGQLKKQEVTLADCTAACRAVVWESAVGTVKEDQTYKFMNVTIRSFNGAKFISLSPQSTIEEVADIGEVVDDDVEEGGGGIKVVKGEVVGVVSCERYVSCMECKAKVVDVTATIGACTKCGMKMKLSRCPQRLVARLRIEDEAGATYTVTAFQQPIDDIIRNQEGADDTEKLLSAPVMKFTITKDDILSAVTFL